MNSGQFENPGFSSGSRKDCKKARVNTIHPWTIQPIQKEETILANHRKIHVQIMVDQIELLP
jgi:hypothetical protein